MGMTGPDYRILTGAEISAADAAAEAAGIPVAVLMQRAGVAVADAVVARWTPRPTVVLCGPGNNGGDGYVAAAELARRGWPVRVATAVEPARLKGAAAEAAQAWTGVRCQLTPSALEGAELVIDALYGVGLTRPLAASDRDVLRRAQQLAPIVGVDLPSGLSGDTGAVLGHAPAAALTVVFHRKKPAHVLVPGRDLCGEIVVADLGLPAPARGGRALFENHPDVWRKAFPRPTTNAHKGDRGRLVVVSGPAHSTGAARLAARAGLRMGAGLVTVASPPDAVIVNASHLTAVMVKPFLNEEELQQQAEQVDAMVIGPAAGVTEETRLNVLACCRTGAAMVVDADALTVFREDPDELFSALDRDDVLTPHPGEFERILPGLLRASPSRIAAARTAAETAGCIVLLKGPDTVIAAPDGRAAVNTNGVPWLATAGSGDVLAGFIAGLMAQGMDSFEAACAGVWTHGEVGRRFGPGLIAEDLPECLPGVLRELLA
jgi:ADP-dependent NAD(P)H-hydrate dehydratase / NAD(P)H-hydrate epimerase